MIWVLAAHRYEIYKNILSYTCDMCIVLCLEYNLDTDKTLQGAARLKPWKSLLRKCPHCFSGGLEDRPLGI